MGATISSRSLITSADIETYRQQLCTNVVPSTIQQTTRMTQRGHVDIGSHTLYLGANEVFFNKINLMSTVPSNSSTQGIKRLDLNQNILFKHIANFGKMPDDALFWSFLSTRRNTIQVQMFAHTSRPTTLKLTRIDVQTKKVYEYLLKLDAANSSPFVSMPQVRPGFHNLKVEIVHSSTTHSPPIRQFSFLKLTCKRSILSVVRERWRPLATHITFRSTSLEASEKTPHGKQPHVHKLVLGMEKLPSLGAFAPVSTIFGYYGPILKLDGEDPGMNFSLWSYGRAQKHDPPPTTQWARLLALGNQTTRFGEFGHEGTGVKPRPKQSPFHNVKPPYVVALQFECELHGNSQHITTYTSHYWDGRNWKLYAVGQDVTDEKVESIFPKAFIEVPGVPSRQRTNHVSRVIEYEGYVYNANSANRARTGIHLDASHLVDLDGHTMDVLPDGWHQLNTIMEPRGDGYTNKRWYAHNGKLRASCGGLDQFMSKKLHTMHTVKASSDIPMYMRQIHEIDAQIQYPTIVSLEKKDKQNVNLQVQLPFTDDDELQTCKVFYGNQDGLTISRLWISHTTFTDLESGDHTFVVPKHKFYRVLTIRKDGKYWSKHTFAHPLFAKTS